MGNRPHWMRTGRGRHGKFDTQFVDDEVSSFEGYGRGAEVWIGLETSVTQTATLAP